MVTVDLPPGPTPESLANMTAEVAGDHVHISMPGFKPLDIHLPFAVSAAGATAEFAKGNRQLCLKLPYLPAKSFIEQVRCVQQWSVAYVCCSVHDMPDYGCDCVIYEPMKCLLSMQFVLQLRTCKQQQAELTDLSYDSYLELEP